MPPLSVLRKLGKNVFLTSVIFPKREVPVKLILPNRQDFHAQLSISPELYDAEMVWRPIERRLNHKDVQTAMLKLGQVDEDGFKDIQISPKTIYGKEIGMNSHGTLMICEELASNFRGNKTALVLNGGGPRGVMLNMGFVNSLKKHNVSYDIIVDSSAGALIGALLAKHGDPEYVKFLIYKALSNHTVLELADYDTSKGLKILKLNGLIKGDAILHMLRKDLELEDSQFSDMKTPLFITSVETNTGKEMIFCDPKNVYDQLIEDPRTTKKSIDMKFMPHFYQDHIDVAQAVRCSISMPLFFELYRIQQAGSEPNTPLDFTDGGVKENSPFKTAASFISIRNILIGDPGYAGKMRVPYGDQGLIANLMHSTALMMSVQRNALNDPIMRWPLRTRLFNYGAWDIGAMEAFSSAQRLSIVAELSTDAIFDNVPALPNDFWRAWPDTVLPYSEISRFKRTRVDKFYQNTEIIYDGISPITGITPEAMAQLIAKDGGLFQMKEPTKWQEIGFYSKLVLKMLYTHYRNASKKLNTKLKEAVKELSEPIRFDGPKSSTEEHKKDRQTPK